MWLIFNIFKIWLKINKKMAKFGWQFETSQNLSHVFCDFFENFGLLPSEFEKTLQYIIFCWIEIWKSSQILIWFKHKKSPTGYSFRVLMFINWNFQNKAKIIKNSKTGKIHENFSKMDFRFGFGICGVCVCVCGCACVRTLNLRHRILTADRYFPIP